MSKGITPSLGLTMIRQRVARDWGTTEGILCGETRTTDAVEARHVAMYLMRRITGASLRRIGRTLGDRDHVTIINGIRRIEERVAVDPDFRTAMELFQSTIMSGIRAKSDEIASTLVRKEMASSVCGWAKPSFLVRVGALRNRGMMAPAISKRLGVPVAVINAIINETERKDAA